MPFVVAAAACLTVCRPLFRRQENPLECTVCVREGETSLPIKKSWMMETDAVYRNSEYRKFSNHRRVFSSKSRRALTTFLISSALITNSVAAAKVFTNS